MARQHKWDITYFCFSFSPSHSAGIPPDSGTNHLPTAPGRGRIVQCLVFLLCSVASKELGLTVVGICLTYDLFLVNKVYRASLDLISRLISYQYATLKSWEWGLRETKTLHKIVAMMDF